MSSRDQNVSVQSSSVQRFSRIKDQFKSIGYIRYRYIISALLGTGGLIFYLSVASFPRAFRHLHPIGANYNPNYSSECKFLKRVSKVEHVNEKFYSWTRETHQRLDLASPFGMLVASLPSGVLSDIYGGKYFILVSMIVLSLVDLVTPFMLSGADVDFYIVYFWQFLTGIGRTAIFSGTNSILANWAPPQERGRLGSITYCGLQFAVTFHHGISENVILATKMWNAPFFIYTPLVLIWSVLFSFFGFSYYRSKNRWLRQKERQFLEEHLGKVTTFKPKKKVPWLQLLMSLPLWALVIAHLGHRWIWDVMMKNLHFYLRYVLYFDFHTGAALTAIAYMSMGCFTLISGFIADYLTNGEYVQLTTLRKVYTTFASMGPAVFLLAASYTGCARNTAVSFFIAGMSFMGFYFSGARINSLELAPNFSGTVMGVLNTFNIVLALALPKIQDIVAPNESILEKRSMYWVHLAILVFTNFMYSIFGSGELQSWNEDGREEEEVDVTSIEPTSSIQRNFNPPVMK